MLNAVDYITSIFPRRPSCKLRIFTPANREDGHAKCLCPSDILTRLGLHLYFNTKKGLGDRRPPNPYLVFDEGQYYDAP